MEKLQFRRAPLGEFKSHVWVEDILFFDGPILALLKASSRQDYFYYWVDSDESYNRWLAIPVSRGTIEEYKRGSLSLLSVVGEAHDRLFLLDINAALEPRTAWSVEFVSLPDDYLPPAESFYDSSLAPDWNGEHLYSPGRYRLEIAGQWFIEDLIKVPKIYQQLYAFVYTVSLLEKPSVRLNASRIFSALPWRGGFSRVHFYRDLSRVIPSMHEPKIAEIQYASPGKIELELLTDIASKLSKYLNSISESLDAIEETNRKIAKFLKEQKLTKLDATDKAKSAKMLTNDTGAQLQTMLSALTAEMGMSSHLGEVVRLSGDELTAIKIFQSFFIRARELAQLSRDGLLKL
jgi:hypothetical protein